MRINSICSWSSSITDSFAWDEFWWNSWHTSRCVKLASGCEMSNINKQNQNVKFLCWVMLSHWRSDLLFRQFSTLFLLHTFISNTSRFNRCKHLFCKQIPTVYSIRKVEKEKIYSELTDSTSLHQPWLWVVLCWVILCLQWLTDWC